MSISNAIDIADGLLSRPTAPLLEGLPSKWIMSFAQERGLNSYQDGAGNVVVTNSKSAAIDPSPSQLVLVAHLDHPGFVFEGDARVTTKKLLPLTFRGGLQSSHALAGSPLSFFHQDQTDPIGTAVLVAATGDEHGRLSGASVEITEGEILPGCFAMWDFPELAPDGVLIDNHSIKARACDDLLGAAAILACLDSVGKSNAGDMSVCGLFTRAEEVGFFGTLEAIRLGTVPANSVVISLECSKALSSAQQGDGVIVRVGDRMTVFDPRLTEALRVAADQMVANSKDVGFRYQRKLMDGGACEASAFCATGYQASGLALPLGNYHNANDDGPGLAAEHVMISDYLAEVALLTNLALDPSFIDLATRTAPPAWLDDRMAKAQAALNGGTNA